MAVRCRVGGVTNSGVWYGPGSAERHEECRAASGTRETSQRGIDGVGVFLAEPRDQFGGGQNLADAADALAAAPDFLPGFWFCALAPRGGAATHFPPVRLG